MYHYVHMASIKHIHHVHQQIHLIHQAYHVHHQRSMHVLPLLTSLRHSTVEPMHHMLVHVLMCVHIIHHTHKP